MRTNAASDNNAWGHVFFENSSDATLASISARRQSAADDAYLAFSTKSSGNTIAERLRIHSSGHIVTQGLTGPSFNNDSSNAKVYEFTGDGTANEYGVINISGNSNTDQGNIGSLRFVNRENSNSSSGGNPNSKALAAIQTYAVTSDSNAGDDSGGDLQLSLIHI